MNLHLIFNKMPTEPGNPIQYYWLIDNQLFNVNQLLNKNLSIKYSGNIFCIRCGRKTSKSFSQGYCYPCFSSAPEAEECVLRPELCQAHIGIARDMDYAKQHCLIDHFVYLAASEQIKVGVTRNTQIPFRWIDQGASSAIKIARTHNRYTAGLIEVALKKFLPDKTNWRAMLTNKIDENPDFTKVIEMVRNVLPNELKQYLINNEQIEVLQYPVLEYPQKVQSLDFEKTPEIKGVLKGIKGQYLFFDGGRVINVRKFGGYEVEVDV
jgi:hypothetical protein